MLATLRLIKLLARGARLPRLDTQDTVVTHWRVMPGDIDAFGHMNNARYQTLMDLARVDFLVRCGLFRGVVKRRWSVPVGHVHLDFRKSLKPFERFELHTRLVHWDERWFYFRQEFFRAGDLERPVASGSVKTLFMGRHAGGRGVVPTDVVVPALAGRPLAAPALPASMHGAFGLDAPALQQASAVAREPLAIVGIGCRLPGGVQDAEGFWQFLMEGGDAIVDIPAERWDPQRYHDPTGRSPGRSYVQRAGLLQQDLRRFDAAFFGIAPREAEVLDPQQRLLLETSWEALEDAGIAPPTLAGSRTGVFTGGFMIDNLLLRTHDGNRERITSATATAGTMTMLASRLAYFYDLRGPALTIDTACSSSLVACHHACESLWRGETDTALVAGVNALLVPDMHVTMAKGQFLSPRGRCHAFSADADGYVRGEGAAVVVLRPLSAAQRDGQRVYAVILGSACNQDGRTPGIAVPSGDAQSALMREAYAAAGVSPRDVVYVEAHGTGTPVGDPIEAHAIGDVVGAGRDAAQRCVIGSVKTNVGHLEAAAGVAGLIKAALAVQHGVAPPHLHAARVNPKIDLPALGLALPQEATALPVRNGRRVAGVNSFGYGGTNAHVVLASAPPVPDRPAATGAADTEPRRGPLVLPISARSEESLLRLADAHAEALRARPEEARALARTAAVHRAHHRHRAVLVADDAPALADAAGARRFAAHAECDEAARPVFVFSGMGPQWWGMGRQLMASEPVFRRAVLRCDEAFRAVAGWSILDELQRDEAQSRMSRTEVAQPANTVLQIALTELLASWGIRPAAVIGHSVGEVGAAFAAGTLDTAGAMTVAFHRSRLQQRMAGRGGMLAAALSPEDAQALVAQLGGGLSVAAVNSARSVTLAGPVPALRAAAAELSARQVFHRELAVEVPYHSPAMDELQPELQRALAALVPAAPRLPVYSTVSGGPLREGERHDAAYWWRNVREPVLFAPALRAALADGHRLFVEVGPHPVLAAAMREGVPEPTGSVPMLGTLSRRTGDDASLAALLARLYTLGADIDWPAYCGRGRAVPAPRYPWHRKLHWSEHEASARARTGAYSTHPLLTTHEPGPMSTWAAELNLGRAPFWLDHVVAGVPLFPAAGQIELALAAHQASTGQVPVTLEHVDLVAGVELNAARATTLRLQHAADAPAFRISAQTDDGEPQLCARGQWAAGAATSETLDLRATLARLPQRLAPHDLYARLAQMGLRYGPAFRAVRRLRHGGDEVMAWLETPPALADGCLLPPTLLDAALHSLLALAGGRYDGCDLVPTGLRELSLYRSPGHQAVVVGRFDAGAAEPRCDLVITTRTGEVCARVRGLTFRVLPRNGEGAAAPLYERRYAPQALAERPEREEGPLIVLGQAGGVVVPGLQAEDHRALARLLTRVRAPARVLDLRFMNPPSPLADRPQPLVQAAEAANRFLATLQALRPDGVSRYVLVTRRAEQGPAHTTAPDLTAALVTGMARTAMTERPDLKLTHVDIDDWPPQPADWLARLGDVQEWLLRDGRWHAVEVARLEAAPAGHDERRFDPATMDCEIALGKAGRLDSLHFAECMRTAPGPGQVEVAVDVVPLGYKDVMKSLGILSARAAADTYFGDSIGMECAGRVVALGDGVDHLAVGDRVFAVAPGTLRTHLVADARMVARLPEGVSMEVGANLVTFCTVYHAFVDVARLGRGETVLIHGGSGGVGMAAITVARWLGARIIATAGTEAKRAGLRALGIEHVAASRDTSFHDDVMRWTGGRGVDVVLNFTPGDTLLRSLSCLARFGRFVEIGKAAFDLDLPLPLRAFNEGLSFTAVDFDRMVRHRPQQAHAIAERVLSHLAAGDFEATPVHRHAPARVVEAFRTLARGDHTGKVMIDLRPQEGDPPWLVRTLPQALVDPAASYLVTGGLGGFGLELARDLVARGARQLVLLSRQGAATPGVQRQLDDWARQGVAVRTPAVDVSDRAALALALRSVFRDLPPLKGVVHAAAVLDDRPIDALDEEALARVFGAKAHGAWHLHELTAGQPLDFFVLCSSVSAVIGNAGQAAYAGANNLLDQLAAWRRAHGLPALSVQWGALGDVGMVARNATLGRHLAQLGVQPLATSAALQSLWSLVARGCDAPAHAAVADVDWARLAAGARRGGGMQRLAGWRDAAADAAHATTWMTGDADTARARIETELLRVIATAMKLEAADIRPHQPLRDLGLDSLMALELSLEIESVFGVKLPTMAVAGGPPPRELAARVAGQLAPAADEPDHRSALPAARLDAATGAP